MSNETIKLLREAVIFERNELANDLLAELNIESVDYKLFNTLLEKIMQYDKKQYKQIHAFELQKVHDEVNFGRLQYETNNPKQISIFDSNNKTK